LLYHLKLTSLVWDALLEYNTYLPELTRFFNLFLHQNHFNRGSWVGILDIRHKDPEMLADISLKTKKIKKKFPGALFFNFLFATLTTAICLSQGV
jgi:hypothetical protein